MLKQVSRLIIDNSCHQTFREVEMQTEFTALFQGFGIELCVTSPVGVKEYEEAGVSIGTSKGTESWKKIDTSSLGYNTKGEGEAIALCMATTNTGLITSDIPAQNRCKTNGIFCQDHVETLFMQAEVNVISIKDARFIYEKWGNGIPKIGTNIPNKYPRGFDCCWRLLNSTVREKLNLFLT